MASGSSHLVARCRLHFSLKWSFKWDTAILGSVFFSGEVKFLKSARWHPTSEGQARLLIQQGSGALTEAERGLPEQKVLPEFINQEQHHNISSQKLAAHLFAYSSFSLRAAPYFRIFCPSRLHFSSSFGLDVILTHTGGSKTAFDTKSRLPIV